MKAHQTFMQVARLPTCLPCPLCLIDLSCTSCPKKVPLKILDTQFRTIASMSRSGEHINLFNVAIVRNRQHVNHLLTFKVKWLSFLAFLKSRGITDFKRNFFGDTLYILNIRRRSPSGSHESGRSHQCAGKCGTLCHLSTHTHNTLGFT